MPEEFKPKIELPKVNFYYIHVRDEPDEPEEYSVQAAKCPFCGEENTDVQQEVLRTCYKCNKQFEIGELDDTKSWG